jgi:uncharacterized protein (TIGR03083 family)
MLLTPRYDDASFLQIDLPLPDVAAAVVGQRQRLAAGLADLDADQWATQSRCEEWSVRDVIAHLVSTNQFWTFSLGSALAGQPTRFLSTFDPVATPVELVGAAAHQSAEEVRAAFVETNAALADVVSGIDEAGWSVIGEAPPGHVPLRAVALHALWDAWVHERDILLPLGLAPVEEPGEVMACLAYAAALSPAFVVAGGSTRAGAIAVEASQPSTQLVVEVGPSVRVRQGEPPDGALRLTGPAVDLLEALSFRGPLPCPVPADQAWLLEGLAEVFDRT